MQAANPEATLMCAAVGAERVLRTLVLPVPMLRPGNQPLKLLTTDHPYCNAHGYTVNYRLNRVTHDSRNGASRAGWAELVKPNILASTPRIGEPRT